MRHARSKIIDYRRCSKMIESIGLLKIVEKFTVVVHTQKRHLYQEGRIGYRSPLANDLPEPKVSHAVIRRYPSKKTRVDTQTSP